MKKYIVEYMPSNGDEIIVETESPDDAAKQLFESDPRDCGIAVCFGLFNEWAFSVHDLLKLFPELEETVLNKFPEVLERTQIIDEDYPESLVDRYHRFSRFRFDKVLMFWFLVIMMPIIGFIYLLKFLFVI